MWINTIGLESRTLAAPTASVLGMPRLMNCSRTENLSKSDLVLLDSVLEWYNEDSARVEAFLSIVKRKNGMSLRVIDWLVTNYSKTNTVLLATDQVVPRDLSRDYQKNLSAYNKRNMDPFARKHKILITALGKESRSSTVGQLNFFRWFLKNDIHKYLQLNKSVIEDHMKAAESRAKKGSHCRTSKVRYTTKSYSGKFMVTF